MKSDGLRIMKDGEGEMKMKKIIGYEGKHNTKNKNCLSTYCCAVSRTLGRLTAPMITARGEPHIEIKTDWMTIVLLCVE